MARFNESDHPRNEAGEFSETGSGEKPRIVSSKAMQQAVLKNTWARFGRDLDYDDIWQTAAGERAWEKEIADWNREHGTDLDADNFKFELSGPSWEFRRHFEKTYLEGRKAPFPGVRAANEYFADSEDTWHLMAVTSEREAEENTRGLWWNGQCMAYRGRGADRRQVTGDENGLG